MSVPSGGGIHRRPQGADRGRGEPDGIRPAVECDLLWRVWRIAPASLTVANEIGKPMALDIVETSVNQVPTTLTSPKLSIEVLEFPVQ